MIESVENPFRPGEWITLDSRLADVLPSLVSLKIRRAVDRLANERLSKEERDKFGLLQSIRLLLSFRDTDIGSQPQIGPTSMSCVHRLRKAFTKAAEAPPSTLEDRIATLEANVAKILAAFASLTPPPR